MALHIADITAEKRGQSIIGAALVLAVLAGCMAERAPVPVLPGKTARVEPPAGFFLNRDGDMVSLAYGLPNSDAVTLMLSCTAGKRAIEITDAGHKAVRDADMLVLVSGKMESALPIKLMADESSGGMLALAKASPDLPALEGFRRSGAITVKLAGKSYSLTANPAEKPQVARFFGACERK